MATATHPPYRTHGLFKSISWGPCAGVRGGTLDGFRVTRVTGQNSPPASNPQISSPKNLFKNGGEGDPGSCAGPPHGRKLRRGSWLVATVEVREAIRVHEAAAFLEASPWASSDGRPLASLSNRNLDTKEIVCTMESSRLSGAKTQL